MFILLKTGLAVAVLLATTLSVPAQMAYGHQNGPGDGMEAPTGQGMPPHASRAGSGMLGTTMQGQGGMGLHAMMPQPSGKDAQPTLPGQDAFGAIQEVVRLLEADPKTDWSKVDIAALREHLIDMNEVTLHAAADERRLDNGVEVSVTGEGRVLDAIRRMVPAQARELNGMNAWSATTGELPNGVRLTVTTSDPEQVPKLQALGFMGLMVQGAHHQPHHLAIATGRLQH